MIDPNLPLDDETQEHLTELFQPQEDEEDVDTLEDLVEGLLDD